MSTSAVLANLKPALPQLESASPETNGIEAFKLVAAQHIASVLNIPLQQAFDGLETNKKDVDLNVPVPKFRLKAKPQELASKIADEFVPNDYLAAATANGINVQFKLQTAALAAVTLNQINDLTFLSETPSYGSNTSGKGKTALIEFASPNIAKPFHAGHLRSTIIGAFLANLYEYCGWNVIKANYLGDWGKQFGLLSVGFRRYGSQEELKQNAIMHLYHIYVKVNAEASAEITQHIKDARAARRAAGEENVPADDAAPTRPEEEAANTASPTHTAARKVFEAMENDDPKELELWQQFRNLSIEKYKETFGRLNVSFDEYLGESQVSRKAQTDAFNNLVKSDFVSEDKGALLADLRQYKLEKTIIRKRDGTTTYMSRDIGGAVERYEKYKFDKMLYVAAAQQDLHFAQFFKILQLMGYEWADRLEHVNFGMILGMSTRKGTVKFLDEIMEDAGKEMHEKMKTSEEKYAQIDNPEYTADILGQSAIKIQDMSAKRIGNYQFSWDRMLSYLGDTGPYLQYAHVRLTSVVRKSEPEVSLPPAAQRATEINTEHLTEPKAHEVLLLLSAFPDAVKMAMKTNEPSAIVNYCWKLTHAISSAYEVLLVRGAPSDVAMARLYLYVCAREVLAAAMRLLTLTPLERM